MTLTEFRKTRRLVTVAEAKAELPHIADMDFESTWTHCLVYAGGAYILTRNRMHYLDVEGGEYTSTDLPLLEFILWQWLEESDSLDDWRTMVWG